MRTPGKLLLEFPQSIINWGEFASANNFKGWLDPAVPLCQWTGVQCDSNGRVTALCALTPPASKHAHLVAHICTLCCIVNLKATPHSHAADFLHRRRLSCALCTVRAAGALPGALAGLDRLQTLVVSSNWLNGTLPASFAAGFASLQELHLDFNSFSGGLPEQWLAQRESLPALRSLALEGNLLTGTLPEAAPGALQSLQSLGLQWNQLQARPRLFHEQSFTVLILMRLSSPCLRTQALKSVQRSWATR